MGRNDLWCVLRTTGPSTVPLFRSLTEAGFDVWTPVEVQLRQRPRSKAKAEREFAVMPTYLFAAARHVDELAALSHFPGKDHKDFGVWHVPGRGFPLIADAALAPLRLHERKVVRKDRVSPFAKGERVHIPDGPFAGIEMFVEEERANSLRLRFSIFGKPCSIKAAKWHVLRAEPDSAIPRAA